MAFKFKVAYTTNPDNILPALEKGLIDEGDLIILNQDGKGSMRFILQDKSILPFSAEIDEKQLSEAIDSALGTNIDEKIAEAVDNTVGEILDENLEEKIKPIVENIIGEIQENTWGTF